MAGKQKRIVVPTDGPLDWKALLADPEKHWRSGYSAMSTAYSWEEADGLPAEIAAIFKNADNPALRDAKLALAIPEYKVDLKGGTRPSQNDVFALMSCSDGLISMMVEGKAREDFDATLGDWKKRTSAKGVKDRLGDIMENLGLPAPVRKKLCIQIIVAELMPYIPHGPLGPGYIKKMEPGETDLDNIRYQLLHRAASAVIEAKRFHAKYAVLLIQSFEEDDTKNHYDDFEKFVGLFEKKAAKDKLIELSRPDGRPLYAAWIHSKAT